MFAFTMPRFNEGEFGGTFTVGTVAALRGLVALYKVCVHLGCLYAWVDSTVRFECPCHGSKYQEDGTYFLAWEEMSLAYAVVAKR